MKRPHLRKLWALAVAAALTVPLAGPAFAADESTANTPAPAEGNSAEFTAGSGNASKVDVVVILKNQPKTPSDSAESKNIATQDKLLDDWSSKYGVEVRRQFGYLVNGFSATVPADQLLPLSEDPRVLSVRKERLYKTTEYSARELEGVVAANQKYDVDGTGMVVSIIDTGLDMGHQDMRLDAETSDSCGPKAKLQPAPGFTCKVPNGYNYADQNNVVKDLTSSQHGMHVGGIVAANGSVGDAPAWDSRRIDGVAPNAQLLAMKVFSNGAGEFANDGDIINAIEDSVKMGADVINMSLGSSNGQNNSSDGSYRAMAKAREEGVLVVVSAGNSGLNYSYDGTATDDYGYLDDGVVGTPGSQASAFTVASVENAFVTVTLAKINGGAETAPFSEQSGPQFDQATYDIVGAGLGRVGDFNTTPGFYTGKVALIKRGEIGFADKLKNAEDAGAAGVVVYNHELGGEDMVSMAGTDAVSIPSVFMGNAGGTLIANLIAAGNPVTIQFSQQVDGLPNAAALTPSDFTSWGPTPSLDFKPQIAGIGGNVYSTLNDNHYGSKSGTSMAAPNVTGLSALMLQKYQDRFVQMPKAQRVDLAEIALMNTAEILEGEDGLPYAPRQMGAGLAQVDKALDTSVFATVDGVASAALREVNDPTSFTVTLTNRGADEAKFAVPEQLVLTEGDASETDYTNVTYESGATLSADASSVTVPAGGERTVEFTLTPDASEEGFVEGWARFTSLTDGQPDLAVPYLGFVGDWDEEPILMEPGTNFEYISPSSPIFFRTTQLVRGKKGWSEIGGDVWISPNQDGNYDVLYPSLFQLRSIANVKYSVLDSSGNLVKNIGSEQDLARMDLPDILSGKYEPAHNATSEKFDGQVWNAKTGSFEVVPDGQYTYRIDAQVREGGNWQTYDLPFGVDVTAPEISVGALVGNKLTFSATDDGAGVDPSSVKVDHPAGYVTSLAAVPGQANTWELTVNDAAVLPFLTFNVSDKVMNKATVSKVVKGSGFVIANRDTINSTPLGPQSPLSPGGNLIIKGIVSDDVTRVTVDGTDTAIVNGSFKAQSALVEGSNSIAVVAYGSDGNIILEDALTPTYDSVPPTIQYTSLNAEGKVPVVDGDITIAGTVTDNRAGATLSVLVNGVNVPVNADGTFTYTYTPDPDDYVITVKYSDVANSVTEALLIEGRQMSVDDSWAPPAIDNVYCNDLTACFVDGNSPSIGADGTSVTLTGSVTGKTSSISFTPGSRATETGVIPVEQPIYAQIDNEAGTFTVTLPVVGTGVSDYRLRVSAPDSDGNDQTMIDRHFSIYFDTVAPSIDFENPVLHGGSLITNSENVKFKGQASDDGWGYQLKLNDSSVLELENQTGLGPDSNLRTFDTDLTVADKDLLNVDLTDMNGNALVGLIPVVLDQTLPTASITGVDEGQTINPGAEISAVAEDEHLASAQMFIDGKPVSTQSSDLAADQKVQNILVDARFLDAGGDLPSPVEDFDSKFEFPIDTSALGYGDHTAVLVTTDLAGNTSANAVSFTLVADREVVRHGGKSRYDTSFEVAKSVIKPGKPLFIATGTNFPDALSGGSAAASVDGSLILVDKSVPKATLDLLKANVPSAIYLLGGKSVVPDKVASQLKTATSVSPVRISGADRYATSAAVTAKFFANATCAYVASGRDFPDALAASGKAGHEGCPIVLYGPSGAKLGASVTDVKLVGGGSVVPAAFEQKLKSQGKTVERFAGKNRYETSQSLQLENASEVWVANGSSFADALSAAAPSGKAGNTMILSMTSCIPEGAMKAIGIATEKVHIVGGEGALSKEVFSLETCK